MNHWGWFAPYLDGPWEKRDSWLVTGDLLPPKIPIILHLLTTGWCPPVISWFISPLTIDISPKNHSYGSCKPT